LAAVALGTVTLLLWPHVPCSTEAGSTEASSTEMQLWAWLPIDAHAHKTASCILQRGISVLAQTVYKHTPGCLSYFFTSNL